MRKLAAITAAAGALLAIVTTHVGPGAVADTGPGIVHDDVVVEAPTARLPRIKGGKVWAIVEWGDLVVVGGKFTTVREPGGPDLARSNIFAFSKTTGKIDTRFAPAVGKSVRAIVVDPDGRGLFVGGSFSNVNGQSRRGLVFLNRDGQRVSNWAGRPNGPVYDLTVRDRTLYVGGRFSRISGVDRSVFATVDIANGQTTNESTVAFSDARYTQFRGMLELRRFEISPDGTRMVVLGNFQQVDGQVRDQVVVLDVGASPDQVAPWSTVWFDEPCNGSTTIWPYFVRDVAISPDNSYFVVATVGGLQSGPPNPCDQVTRFEMANGLNRQPTWISYSGGDSVLSVEATGEAVYAGGHFRWMNNPYGRNNPGPGAVARGTLAAFDPATGAVLPWNPGRQPRGQGVLVMEASTDGLWIGHDTSYVNGKYSPRMAHFGLPDEPPPTTTTTTLPGTTEVEVFATGFDDAHGWTTDAGGTDTASTGAWGAGAPQQTESSGAVMQRGDVTSGSQALVTDVRAGTSVGSYDVDGGVTSAMSPAFTIPAGATSASMSFDAYLAHLANAGADDFLRIEVIDGPNATVVHEVLGAGTVRTGAWQSTSVDLSPFIGRTVNLRVSAADSGTPSLIEAGLDTLSVRALIPGA